MSEVEERIWSRLRRIGEGVPGRPVCLTQALSGLKRSVAVAQ